jgi:hypothetical protein
MRRRIILGLVVFTALLLGYPAFLLARAKYFPKHYDVVSIAALPEYQDPLLLRRAWTLPVAASYGQRVEPQRNVSMCGPTAAANVLRSLGSASASASAVLDGTGRCRLFGYCWNGLTLDELAGMLGSKTDRKVTVLRDLSLAEFREHMARSNDAGRRYVVNFHRGLLFGKGGGHHSPVGGYLPDRDLVFVLDVNSSYGPWLVPTERLFAAVDSVDPSSHRKRGLAVVE